jgi:hypothetical protein
MRLLVPLWLLLIGCSSPVGTGDGSVDESEVPGVGWTAVLQTHFHDTAGTAEIVDESTILLRDFVFDGEGIDARLFLLPDGAQFNDNYELTDNLVGDGFAGETLTLPIPDQAEMENWNLITLWCVPAGASFGDGVFVPPE